jgi:hypothetical protein
MCSLKNDAYQAQTSTKEKQKSFSLVKAKNTLKE